MMQGVSRDTPDLTCHHTGFTFQSGFAGVHINTLEHCEREDDHINYG